MVKLWQGDWYRLMVFLDVNGLIWFCWEHLQKTYIFFPPTTRLFKKRPAGIWEMDGNGYVLGTWNDGHWWFPANVGSKIVAKSSVPLSFKWLFGFVWKWSTPKNQLTNDQCPYQMTKTGDIFHLQTHILYHKYMAVVNYSDGLHPLIHQPFSRGNCFEMPHLMSPYDRSFAPSGQITDQVPK